MLSINNNNLSGIPKMLSSNNACIIKPAGIANVFNNYFTSIPAKTNVNVNYSHKHFFDFLKKELNTVLFFFSYPTDKYEIADIVSSLDSYELVGSYSIPN